MQTKEHTMTIAIIAAAIALTIVASIATIVELGRDGYRQVPTREF